MLIVVLLLVGSGGFVLCVVVVFGGFVGWCWYFYFWLFICIFFLYVSMWGICGGGSEGKIWGIGEGLRWILGMIFGVCKSEDKKDWWFGGLGS